MSQELSKRRYAVPRVLVVAAQKGPGLDEIRRELAGLCTRAQVTDASTTQSDAKTEGKISPARPVAAKGTLTTAERRKLAAAERQRLADAGTGTSRKSTDSVTAPKWADRDDVIAPASSSASPSTSRTPRAASKPEPPLSSRKCMCVYVCVSNFCSLFLRAHSHRVFALLYSPVISSCTL